MRLDGVNRLCVVYECDGRKEGRTEKTAVSNSAVDRR